MGNKGNKSTTQTSQAQTYYANPAIQQSGELAMNQAMGAAQTPFSMPTAPVAPFNPFQQQAFGQVQGAQGMTDPYFQQASQYINQSANPLTDVSAYFNPMTSAVTDQLKNIFGQQNRQATGSATQAAGGVGADRIGVAQGNLANQQTLGAGQVYSQLYGQAQAAAQADAARKQSAGFAMGQLGPAAQAANLQATSALGGAGNQQQQQTQQQLNAPYQNILASLAYPFQTSQFLAGITGGLAPAFGGTTTGVGNSTTQNPTPSLLNQILGVGTSAAGLLGGSGAFGTGKGGSASPQIGSTYGATDNGSGFGYGSYGGAQVPTFFRRGGKVIGKVIDLDRHEYADGGDIDGADQSSPPPFPYLSLPKTGASPIPTIHLPMGGGQFHNNLQGLDKGAPQQSQSSNSSGIGDVAKIASAVLPFLLAATGGAIKARGGAVNPFAAGEGFQEGGDAEFDPGESWEPEPLQGIDAPMGNTNPHWTMGDLGRRAEEFYGNPLDKVAPVDKESKFNVGKYIRPEEAEIATPDVPLSRNTAVPDIQTDMGSPQDLRWGADGTEPTRGITGPVPLPKANPLGGLTPSTREMFPAIRQAAAERGVNFDIGEGYRPQQRQNILYNQGRGGPGSGSIVTGTRNSNHTSGNAIDVLPTNGTTDRQIGDTLTDLTMHDPRFANMRSGATFSNLYDPRHIELLGNREARTPGEPGINAGDGVEVAGAGTDISARERNPFGRNDNSDMEVGRYHLAKGDQPYPDALDRDWGQKFARSPWMSLVKAGAAIASTTGPVGTAIGHGFAAGADSLEHQRKELRTEQDQNMKADHLFQQAQAHLDQYQRMTPYQRESLNRENFTPTYATTENGHPILLERKSGRMIDGVTQMPIDPDQKLTTRGGQGAGGVWKLKHDMWLSTHPDDKQGALDYAGGHKQMSDADIVKNATIAAQRDAQHDPEASANYTAYLDARKQKYIDEYRKLNGMAGVGQAAQPSVGDKKQFKDKNGNDVTGVWDGTQWKPEAP